MAWKPKVESLARRTTVETGSAERGNIGGSEDNEKAGGKEETGGDGMVEG